jgi:cyclic pyranopterin phosphate synthase
VALSHCAVRLVLEEDAVAIEATCRTTGPTGVEMEALAAVSAAALTVYDMLKAVERGMVVSDIRLERKEGGRSGLWQRPEGS